MALFTTLAVTGAIGVGTAVAVGAAVYGTAASLSMQQRAMRAQGAAAQTQVRMQQQQATRQRRQAIRANIIRRQQLGAQAQAMGVGDTSMVAGGLTGLSSQLGANLGFGAMMSGLGQQYTSQTGQAAQLSGLASMYGTIGQLGFQGLQSSTVTGFGAPKPTPAPLPYTMPNGIGIG